MPELSRSGCLRRKCASPRSAGYIEKYQCRSSILPRHIISNRIESRPEHAAGYIYTSENRRAINSSLYQKSPSGTRLAIPKSYNLSTNSLCSPPLLGLKTRMAPQADEIYGSYKNSTHGNYAQDVAAYKDIYINNMLPDDSENMSLYYSGSDLDTSSVCGHCGHWKLCNSPLLSWNLSGKHYDNYGMDKCLTRSTNKMPFSPTTERGKKGRMQNKKGSKMQFDSFDTIGIDKGETKGQKTLTKSFSLFRKSRSNPSLVKLLCWRNDNDEGISACHSIKTNRSLDIKRRYDSKGATSVTIHGGHARVNVMLRYLSDREELHVTLLEALNLVRPISKPTAVFAKICIMPGKQQTKFSERRYQTCNPIFEEDFLFNINLQGHTSCELRIKFYNKPGIFSSPEALGTCTIPLHRLKLSSVADIICQELTT